MLTVPITRTAMLTVTPRAKAATIDGVKIPPPPPQFEMASAFEPAASPRFIGSPG